MKSFHFLITGIFTLYAAATSILDEQRCYYDAGKLAPADYIPCYGYEKISPCCKRGNKCMEEGSCWDAGTGITYQYGCDDPTYQHKNCPKKCGLNREKSNWVGLVWCSETWLCHHPDECGKRCPSHTPWDPLLERLPPIDCKDMSTKYKAMDAQNPLIDITTLPSEDKLVEKYLSLHPTVALSQSSTASTPTSDITTVTNHLSSSTVPSKSHSPVSGPTETSTESPPPPRSNKGMAIGLGLGVPITLAAVGALAFILRRHRNMEVTSQPDNRSVIEQGQYPSSPGTYNGSERGYPYKAELPADDRPLHEMSSPTARTELEGSSIIEERSNAGANSLLGSPLVSEFSEMQTNENGMPRVQGNHMHGRRLHDGLGLDDQVHGDQLDDNEIHELPG